MAMIRLHGPAFAREADTPDAIAVTADGKSVTYRELTDRARGLAARLRVAGVRAETLVGVVADRSVESLAAFLGVLSTGGAYVPITVVAGVRTALGITATFVPVDGPPQHDESLPPGDAAYVIFTSAVESTGALFNEFGPTERAVRCTSHRCTGADEGPRVPIGPAVPGVRVPDRRRVPDREVRPMNLDLDPAQRPLTDTVRRTASLTDVSPRDAFDWCLAHEELGTHLIAPDASQDLLLRAGQSCGQRMTAATEAWAQVLVSHRFATVTMADPVLAMGDRRIDQVGTRPTSAGEQGARTR